MSPLTPHAAWLLWLLTVPVVVEVPLDTGHIDVARGRPPVDSGRRTSTQPPPKAETSGREFFASWGYNGDRYANSDIHFSQPSLGNDFTIVNARIRDSKGWTDGLFAHSLTVPQYNVRIGFFFNEKWGVELAHDHIKWIVKEDQTVRRTGTLNGAPVEGDVALTADVLRYQLNNGANPMFFNLIRRWRLTGEPGRTGHLVFLAKAGAGFPNPHTENTVFGVPNDKGFQFVQGWNVDGAAAVRLHLWKPLYFEFEEKLLYASYHGIKIDRGTAKNNVKASEFSFSFGVSFR